MRRVAVAVAETPLRRASAEIHWRTNMSNKNQMNYDENQSGIFKHAPLPWRYDSNTRNVIAADGSLVCRNGDDVYGVPEIGEAIVKVFNAIPDRMNNKNENRPSECLADSQTMVCTQGAISRQLVTIARAAHDLCDNTEEDHTGEEIVLRMPAREYYALETALARLDELPDPLDEAATGPRKAEYWLEMAGPDCTQKPEVSNG